MTVALRTCFYCGRTASAVLFTPLTHGRWRCKSTGMCKRRIRAQPVRMRP